MKHNHAILEGFLLQLNDRLEDSDFWYEFESFLRSILMVGKGHSPDACHEDEGFQRLLMVIFQKPDKFIMEEPDPEEALKKHNYIVRAYHNCRMKEMRHYLRYQIKVLKAKEKVYGLSDEDEVEFNKLRSILKKL